MRKYRLYKLFLAGLFLLVSCWFGTFRLFAAEGKPPVGDISPMITDKGSGEGSFNFITYLIINAGKSDSSVDKYYSSLNVTVNRFAKILTVAAGVMFFFVILLGGYRLVFSGGKQEQLAAAKKNITTGILGLLIVFAAYWIAQALILITGINYGT